MAIGPGWVGVAEGIGVLAFPAAAAGGHTVGVVELGVAVEHVSAVETVAELGIDAVGSMQGTHTEGLHCLQKLGVSCPGAW